MPRESVVEIPTGSGNRYRYVYNESTRGTDYLGPVGDAPTISEDEFFTIIDRPILNILEQHGFMIEVPSFQTGVTRYGSPKEIDVKEAPLYFTIHNDLYLTNLILTKHRLSKHREEMSVTTVSADIMKEQYDVPDTFYYQPKYRIFDDDALELLLKGDENWWKHTRLSSLQREII